MTSEKDEILNEILNEINESEPVKENDLAAEKKSDFKDKTDRINHLPISRIKQIIKMDPDVRLASNESVFLIAKAAEMFIETLAKDSYSYTVGNKKKTIQRRDVDSAITNADALIFLEGMLEP